MIVYQAHNRITDCFYIGKTNKNLSTRIRQHYNDAKCYGRTYFHKAIMKYPKDAFEWIVIKAFNDKNECNQAEIFWINIIKSCRHKIYNLTNGGDGGSRPGKMNPNYGKCLNDETKQKISKRLKEYYKINDNPMLGKVSPMKNVKHTQEARNKISQEKKGIKRLDMLGSNNKSARPIYCITTDEYFEYAKKAAEKYNSDLSSIIKCCKGKIELVKGKAYKYAEPGVYGWVEI